MICKPSQAHYPTGIISIFCSLIHCLDRSICIAASNFEIVFHDCSEGIARVVFQKSKKLSDKKENLGTAT